MSHRRFGRVGRLHLGYHRRQVDAFLAHIEVALAGGMAPPTAADIRRFGFELVHGGYSPAEVDAHLDDLEARVALLLLAAGGRRRGRVDEGSEAAALTAGLAGTPLGLFPGAGRLRRGYRRADVDIFVARVLVTVASRVGPGEVTAEIVRAVQFRPARGGYREDAVDDALDRVVEHLLFVRRESDDRGGSSRAPTP